MWVVIGVKPPTKMVCIVYTHTYILVHTKLAGAILRVCVYIHTKHKNIHGLQWNPALRAPLKCGQLL